MRSPSVSSFATASADDEASVSSTAPLDFSVAVDAIDHSKHIYSSHTSALQHDKPASYVGCDQSIDDPAQLLQADAMWEQSVDATAKHGQDTVSPFEGEEEAQQPSQQCSADEAVTLQRLLADDFAHPIPADADIHELMDDMHHYAVSLV